MLKKVIKNFFFIRWKYIFKGSIVIVKKGGILNIGKYCSIYRSIIKVDSCCSLSISDSSTIAKSRLYVINKNSSLLIGKHNTVTNSQVVVNGNLCIGDENILENGYSYRNFSICSDGNISIGNRNRLRGRIWLRYGGSLKIGDYNNINEDSEIRCDESITVGSFNQISYECMIWDTNTHNIYPAEKRRALAESKYPCYGYEFEKPKTKAVCIGDDCWIGKRVSILKGATIGNRCIIGFGTTVSNQVIPNNKTVTEQKILKLYDNQI
ncbi:acyltransferase [Bacteroides caecigallinarum]|uniref:acyltransferase n=1 Tax=Bacteroides caecigallinarum TaxID=1411144 RepID=UPI001DE26939|nr:hypothetical protein [Bacteroides caecigallinarum]MBM6884122.1 hypothetical protein [Bacteroides caecigallinarum]